MDLPFTRPPESVRVVRSEPVRTPLALYQRLLLSLGLALLLWLPRGLELGHFVAVDERSWLTRSGNFYLALATGDWASTFQRYHPGVTTMWLGMLGFLWQYPDYPAEAAGQISSMSTGIEDFLVTHNHPPMEVLAAGRAFVVLATVLLLVLAFWLAIDLFGWLPALIGMLLVGLEPMGLGLTRMLHVDGLSSALMLVSLLAYMRFRAADPILAGQRRDLVLSAIMAGLAWLTKSPALFLGPMVLLLTGIYLLHIRRTRRRLSMRAVRRTGRELVIWGLIALLVFVIFWPAMWVHPIASVQAILGAAEELAEEGHDAKIFFNGEALRGDPGAFFYPITYLWHITPITLIGLVLALVAGVNSLRRLLNDKASRKVNWYHPALMLLLYALLFTLFISFSSKKFDRYLLPAYFPLAIVAAVGWCALAGWLAAMPKSALWGRWLLPLVLVGQMAFVLPHFPYYFTFYNPLLGGSARAQKVLMLGLGEGMDEAARYLNAKPDAEHLRVAAWYRGGSFNYIFKGPDRDLDRFFESDYAVLYIHQWQRQVPDVQTMEYFATLTPEHIVKLHGLDYAWIYDLHKAPPPSYFTDWGGAIRLVETELLPSTLRPGDALVVRLRLYTTGTMDSNLSAIVRLMDAGGNEVARSMGWPYGSPTSTWKPGDIYVDGHEFTLPANLTPGYLRVEVGFYDNDAQQVVKSTVAGTDIDRGDFVAVGYLAAGLEGRSPTLLANPPLLGDQIQLTGARLLGQELSDDAPPRVEAVPTMPLLLAWQPIRPPRADYVTLVHLMAPDGSLVAQYDRAPLQGGVPTTMWREGDTLLDTYQIDIPPDLPSGEYRLLIGLYDLPTLARLPVQHNAEVVGDTIEVATIIVP